MATRRTQPYRKGAREPGAALQAMTRGRTMGGYNPQDAARNVQRLMNAGKARKAAERTARPPRPPRPAR
jgi:hypothetical protein